MKLNKDLVALIQDYLYTCDKSLLIHQLKLIKLITSDFKNSFEYSIHTFQKFSPYTIKHYYKWGRDSQRINQHNFCNFILKKYTYPLV